MARKKTWIGKVASHLAGRVKAIPKEIYGHITDRVIPQGSAEIAHSLYSGSGYLPYGPGQRAVETEQSKGGPGSGQRTADSEQSQTERDSQQRGNGQEPPEQSKSNDGLEM